ncbi:MAG: ribosomal L7Ae/L30e/S12e/Gadd45 family protein [archaeon]|nr:ribosomal L7Ae/L30e/S12e/Gadd45 family protein [archaeon]
MEAKPAEETKPEIEYNLDMSKLPISKIAKPMASEKLSLKLLNLIQKLSKYKLIRRGVKEVNKFYRRKEYEKSESICVLAGDVSPIDVICHIPILCEKNNVPYIYIPSRQALGIASQTKRPTSVIILIRPPEDNKYYEKFGKIKQVINEYLKAEDEEL